jgi:hypothetical protein
MASGRGEAALLGSLSLMGGIGLAIGVAGLAFAAWDHQRRRWKREDLEGELDDLATWATVLDDIEAVLALGVPAEAREPA